MKKIITSFIIFFVLLSGFSFSQTFDILDESNQVISSSTVNVVSIVNGEAVLKIKIKNKTDGAVDAFIRKNVIEKVEGSTNDMCSPNTRTEPNGGMCVGGDVTPVFKLLATETSDIVKITFNQGQNEGSSTIEYSVINNENSEDIATIKVIYTPASNGTNILEYSLKDVEILKSNISEPAKTVNLTVPKNTDLTSLKAVFKLSSGAKAYVGETQQVSGETANDFTSDVIYVVKSGDEENTTNWTISIKIDDGANVPQVLKNDIKIYPNPAINSFTINYAFDSKSYVEIYNVLGKVVERVTPVSGQTYTVDCSKWEKGYYFCRLINNGKVEKTIKVVVTR